MSTNTIIYELDNIARDEHGNNVQIMGIPRAFHELDGTTSSGITLQGNTRYIGVQPMDADVYFSFDNGFASPSVNNRYGAKGCQIVFVAKPDLFSNITIVNK